MWQHKKVFMVHGVAREKGRGVPVCLCKKKEKTDIAVVKAMWTLKVATIRDDPEALVLVLLPLYDINPFYFMSNVYKEKKRKQITLQMWHKGFQIMVEMPFLHLNCIGDYNNGMNNLDLALKV